MRKLVVGILAHVDAGKTTLAEGLLYTCGMIRKLGRVDHRDAFLDHVDLERKRGITIFSKQAELEWKDLSITLLDTPGHVDFSAEMERTLQVLDYAILVISGADGVQGHVPTLWRLLARYQVPVFLFVNKMDQPDVDREALLAQLRRKLDGNIVDLGSKTEGSGLSEADGGLCRECLESLALCGEDLMEEYLSVGSLDRESIAGAIADRRVFPCFFGSALKMQGIQELLEGIREYTLEPEYPQEFGARVYKIARDTSGNRLTYLKVTGGSLQVKSMVGNGASAGEEGAWTEKADQLRIYNGISFQTVERVEAGGICAVTGLTRTFAGQGLGCEEENSLPVLEPVLTYQLLLPAQAEPVVVLGKLRQLEEEIPELHMVWKEETGEIHVQVMGQVQIEILKSLIGERFGLEVEFGTGSIVYKETIAEPVEGIGHFEPLRHYAEVHLLLEPGERGSGLQFASLCSEDMLDRNWQRLVLTHLEERVHPGVLTGSEITDMRIILIAGRAHTKHTEGGDFRQATYRAVRQGLRKAQNILLEPWFSFTLEIPTESLGRAMSDMQRMCGRFEPPVTEGETSVLTGSAPVATMRDYQKEVSAYTRGLGRLSCTLKDYEPCHNAQEVVESIGYDPEADTANPTGSVFCAHGAGFLVNWDRVEEYAHVESGWKSPDAAEDTGKDSGIDTGKKQGMAVGKGHEVTDGHMHGSTTGYITQEEIDAIFRKTYGKKQEDPHHFRRYHRGGRRPSGQAGIGNDQSGAAGRSYSGQSTGSLREDKESYLLVDGYNIIFAWPELKELAKVNLDSARDRLMDILCDYQGTLGSTLILVFDAYKVKGNTGSVQQYHNIYVVYTREAETADQYIEKTVHRMGREHQITVATSDALEQMIIWGGGAMRLSALGLKAAVEDARQYLREEFLTR